MFCKICGKKMTGDAMFCSNCREKNKKIASKDGLKHLQIASELFIDPFEKKLLKAEDSVTKETEAPKNKNKNKKQKNLFSAFAKKEKNKAKRK